MDLLIASYLVAPLLGSVAVVALGAYGLFLMFMAVPLAYACALFPGVPLLALMVRKGWLSIRSFILFGIACSMPAVALAVLAVGLWPLGMLFGLIACVGSVASALMVWAVGVRGNFALNRYSTQIHNRVD